ncbi:hypothetical protein K438DRAFT_1756973 [Mycena galopus ATCC 62051]|nr:hypothetical protein K438DRAFT_1756973 [Mycena galopus ATCC 62051]
MDRVSGNYSHRHGQCVVRILILPYAWQFSKSHDSSSEESIGERRDKPRLRLLLPGDYFCETKPSIYAKIHPNQYHNDAQQNPIREDGNGTLSRQLFYPLSLGPRSHGCVGGDTLKRCEHGKPPSSGVATRRVVARPPRSNYRMTLTTTSNDSNAYATLCPSMFSAVIPMNETNSVLSKTRLQRRD